MTDYARPDVLVETDWIEQHLDDAKVRIIEVDEDTSAFEKGHIPGAIGWNWNTDLHAEVGREYIDQDGLTLLLQTAGVNDDTTVVLYGGNNNWFAAYAYWLLRYLGFGNVKLLNGGRKKWELESRQLAQETKSYPQGSVSVTGPVVGDFRALRDEVLDKVSAGASGTALIDVRSPEEFRGEKLAPDHLPQEQAQVPGHIPGAANIPWGQACNEDGTFKSYDALKQLYESKGITHDKPVIAYCRIGERSSHSWFVLKYLLGHEDVKNYDGSWTEWGNLVGAPVERGA